MRRVSVSFSFVLLVALPAAAQDPNEAFVMSLDDECVAEEGEECGVNALQLSAKRAEAEAKADAESDAAELIELSMTEAESEAEAAELAAAEDAAEVQAESLRALLSPQLRYNSSAPGSRRAPIIATQYEGVEDERLFEVTADKEGSTHIFAVGDWGATLPNHYTAPNKRASGKCPENCEYSHGIDDRAQILVANVMKQRAGTSNPQYVLNVGDNLYWSGIQEDCGSVHATGKTSSDFSQAWLGVYGGLVNKPWISALGNHDYGGYQFNHGWPQQIGYSFVNHNWVMPGRYFTRTMHHPGFSAEYFVIDSNSYDAKSPDDDPMHNICSRQHNPGSASCAAAGGPESVSECKTWFWQSYYRQKAWLKTKLSQSKADWQVVVTHFPCGHDAGFYRFLHYRYGLDFLVTGHRHDQELWQSSSVLGGMTCIVTGGGGGITSEASTHGSMDSTQYGFFDITMSKDKMKLELIALSGKVVKSGWVYKARRFGR